MSIDIFFVNQIPFFITLSRNICFTKVTHLANRKFVNIFKAFKGKYVYYLQIGFQITTVTGDGEFEPMQKLMNELPSASRLNLTSANEHEPYIEKKDEWLKSKHAAFAIHYHLLLSRRNSSHT
jgi:hypothetical protein